MKNNADKMIENKEQLIKHIKEASQYILDYIQKLELGDKEVSFMVFCSNTDVVVESSKDTKALNYMQF